MTTDQQIKLATMQIRKLAKRGTNAKLEELVRGLYTAGIEHGMRAMANELKGRLNDNQILNDGVDISGVWGEPYSPESDGSARPDTNDEHCVEGSSEPV